MGSEMMERPHAVCIPYPAQGHVTPMLKLAKLLHHLRGFYITFVNTEFNHERLLRSRGPDSLKGLEDFRFETIPDGLPPSDRDVTQDIPALCDSTSKNCLAPFRNLLTKLNTTPNTPQVTCIISDGSMSFTLDAADEFRIPEVLFWTPSACGLMCYLHYPQFIDRGLTPLKGLISKIPCTNGRPNRNIKVCQTHHLRKVWDVGLSHDFPSRASPVDFMDGLATCATQERHQPALIPCWGRPRHLGMGLKPHPYLKNP